ncbi:MAG: flagellar basal body L-ring protein FlgH [Gemmobacter sp.]|jgi:flagellar L-ring protein precursor FlgH|nr:flagellar basal body L-ring protein FlgH [Gemmobacter sp.]
MRRLILFVLCLGACSRLEAVGKAPGFTAVEGGYQHHAMYATPLPHDLPPATPGDASSLWSANRDSLFGERRAARRGDILTVVIEIDDEAKISNSSGRSRNGSDSMGIPALFGIPQRLNEKLPEGASMKEAVNTRSASSYEGSGSVSRQEKLTLRIAATVVEELPNGVLRIEGQQEVRVNYELRELIVTGYVRPSDISRQNVITYDKIAGARVSYGGRGQITDVQQPRYGQQIADVVLPF